MSARDEGFEQRLAALAETSRLRLGLPPPEERREIRKRAGITAERLAQTIGVTGGALLHWERGARMPTGVNLTLYAKALEFLREIKDEAEVG